MSTSDAVELELRVVGGETATPLYASARPARTDITTLREQQDETFDEKFLQENHHGDETTTRRQCQPSTIRQEETHRALILRGDKQENAACCGDSDNQTQKPTGARFTSLLFFRLSSSLRLGNPDQRLENNLDCCVQSLTEKQSAEIDNSSCKVNGQTSPAETSIQAARDSPLSETVPAKKREEVVAVVCNKPEINSDFSITHSFSDGKFGPHEHEGLCMLSCGSQLRTGTKSTELESERGNHTKLEKQTDLVEPSTPTKTMLSSTVVTVLAPHWTGRLRRTKRFEETGNLEAVDNLQDMTNTTTNHADERLQESVDMPLTHGSQAQFRAPFLGTRRNTVDYFTKSGPADQDYESKNKMIQSVSLDGNSGRIDNRKRDSSTLSHVATTLSPMSTLSLVPNEQRRNPQTGHQGGLSTLSSKPTTSSLLLSLRRFNSNGRNSNATSNLPEINPSPLSSLPSDRDGKLFTTHLPSTFHNTNTQERSKSFISPSSSSYRTTESARTVPILSPSPLSSNDRERTPFETRFSSSSSTNNDTKATTVTQQPQSANRTRSSLLRSKQAFLNRGPSEKQLNCGGLDKSTSLFSGSSVSSPRHSPYDRSVLLKTHSTPRRTPLTSTSCLKRDTQEGRSPLMFSDAANIKDTKRTNTTSVLPCNGKTDFASPSLIDNKRFNVQIPNNRDNSDTKESVCKVNTNFVTKIQEGTHNLKQRNAEDSLDHESDRLVKQQHGFNLNREQKKPHSLPDVLSSSKISRATAQTIMSHHKDPTKQDVSNIPFTASITELPSSFKNPKSSSTPTESSSVYNNNHCTSVTNSTPTPSHNKDPPRFSKPSLSLATTNPLDNNVHISKTTSYVPLTSNTKTSSSFQSHPVASQTNIHVSSYASSSSHIPKLSNTAHATPLGFERSYTSVLKPFHPKTVSSLIPKVDTISKGDYSSPVSTAFTISSSFTGSHPTAITVPSQSLLTSPVTPVLPSSPPNISISSLLTPPATPVITSPNYSDTSSPNEVTTSSISQERDTKKQCSHVEGKRVRRVTWEDSVDMQHSEPITVEKPEPSEVPTSSPSPSRSPRVKAPSIFSFLRSSSPTTNKCPLSSPTPKTSSIQVKGGKYRSLSSDSADLVSRERERMRQRPSDSMISDQGRQDWITPRQERTLSVECGTVHCHSSAALSLPPDFSSDYKLRYSSPPYSTLMSTRSTQGETKTITPRSPLFQKPPQLNYIPHHYQTESVTDMTLPMSKPSLSPINLPQSPSLPNQNKTATQSSKCGVSETDQLSNSHGINNSYDLQKGQILLVNNRVHVSSQSSESGGEHSSSSTYVTETLVYSIKSKVDTTAVAPKNTTPKPLQHTTNTPVSMETKLSQQLHMVQSKEAADEPHSHSDQSSSGSNSTECPPSNDKSSNRRMRESVLGKSRFFSVESNSEQSPKRSRFALKKSVSTPNSSLSRSESDRSNKTNNKMDQVLNRLRQTFSTRRSEDDNLFPWKWKRASQTPSISGSSDISNVSDVSGGSTKSLDKQEQEKGLVLKDKEKGTEVTNRWTQNKCALTPPSAPGSTMAGDNFYLWADKWTSETDRDKPSACTDHISESKKQSHLTIHSPTMHQCDFYKDNGTDYKPTNQYLPCSDSSPGRSPNASATYPTPFGKSTSSPRSPFSPFSSLSPLSSFPSPDVIDDSVFYSPKLQRRRESSSPCEPGEGISLGGSRRSRASTGPPSASPRQDIKCLESSYADLKYGIEPGKSFSVSSVLSSRPSGPGRISTGSRFMSVGNLSESVLTCGSTGKDLDHWSTAPDWDTEHDCQAKKKYHSSCFHTDKMRSRSLPRSLTRRLAYWSSGVPACPPVNTTTSKPADLWSPNMNTCHYAWDTEGPPTPPPTPPLSPVSRRMSKPCSLSSPTIPSSSGAPQQVESQSPRSRLPSRGYVSSLSTFEESSDSNSDTTTDDEYYLETGEDEEKETEL